MSVPDLQPRSARGTPAGGEFRTAPRTEPQVSLNGRQTPGPWSIDDLSPEHLDALRGAQRHAYAWARNQVGSLGMENDDYANDYSSWVGRRLVSSDFDDAALGSHPNMVQQWDRARADAVARRLAADPQGDPEGLVARMTGGCVLPDADLGRGRAGHSARRELSDLRERLAATGVTTRQVNMPGGGRGYEVASLDGDALEDQVWVGGPDGPEFTTRTL